MRMSFQTIVVCAYNSVFYCYFHSSFQVDVLSIVLYIGCARYSSPCKSNNSHITTHVLDVIKDDKGNITQLEVVSGYSILNTCFSYPDVYFIDTYN